MYVRMGHLNIIILFFLCLIVFLKMLDDIITSCNISNNDICRVGRLILSSFFG